MVPVEELQKLRNEYIFVPQTNISEKIILEHIHGECLEIIAEFSLKECSAEKFGLHVRCSLDGQEKTSVIYDVKDGKIYVDRKYSGKREGGIRTSVVHGNHDSIKLHLFIDRSSLELFVNDGETVMTTRIYPDPLSTSVELYSEGGVANLIKLDSWTLNDIWR
ncbi:GH32 C-terminal domain-containing protein [Bacillus sp. ISL-75]|uniref:GH32 C-terminal domain-containing protein n=1 Tax=Bacillus sp. ISL-75 TaxID=2819137 RepID=UPI001BE7895D|nr:GH32 C-terminal domain-containing protein [Bacillus sp. ISL-75]MBT2728898.1 GH32 C-terminal domain-containing protein [Bacillus sp. ISL-75]